jgi:hypothetical protein
MNLGPGFEGTREDGLPSTVWWVSKSVGAQGDPPKGTIQVTIFNVETGMWSVQTYPPFDPNRPPAGLPDSVRQWLMTEEGRKWYNDPPQQATECSVDLDQDNLEDIEEMNLGTDPTNMDSDGDGFSDGQEVRLGSNPLSPASTPEDLSVMGSCTDGTDNDRDRARDGADLGCRDSDGDGIPNSRDNCPQSANPDQTDWDGDGLGAPCDDDDDGDMIPDVVDRCPDTIPTEEVDSTGCSQRQRAG